MPFVFNLKNYSLSNKCSIEHLTNQYKFNSKLEPKKVNDLVSKY